MTEKQIMNVVKFAKRINQRYPGNGDRIADDRVVALLSRKICKESKELMQQLADN